MKATMMIVLYLRLVYNHLSCWDSLCFLWTHSATHTYRQTPAYNAITVPQFLCGTHASPNTAFLNVLYNVQPHYNVLCETFWSLAIQVYCVELSLVFLHSFYYLGLGLHGLCTVQAFRLWAVTGANMELEHFLIPKSQTVDYLSLNRFRCFRGDYVVQFLDVLFHN